MAIAQIPNQGNGAVDLLSEIFKNANTLFGSGETKTETKDSADPAAMANSNQLLQKLMAGNNPADMDAMIQGILDQAKRSFGPNIAQSIGAGNRALTDTTLATIQGQAQGTATAEAAKAKLDAVAKNNQIMASVVNNQMDASKTRTTTSKTGASPTGNLMKLAGLAGTAYSGAKKVLGKNQSPAPVTTGVPSSVNSVGSGISSAGGGFNYDTDMSPFIGGGSSGSNVDSLFNFDSASANDVLTNFSDYGSGNSIFGNGISSFASDFGGGGAFDEFGNVLDTSAWPDASGFLDFSGGLDGFDAGSSALTSAGSDAFPYAAALNIGNDIISGDSEGMFGDFIGGSVVGDIFSSIGDMSYICSELMRQKLITPYERLKGSLLFRKKLSPTTVAGYHFWGKIFAKFMRKSPVITKIGYNIFMAWQNQVKGKPSTLGIFMHYIIRPLTFLIGFIFGVRIWNKQRLIA